MPGFDGTGPRGMGPMTGGARGFCNPYSAGVRTPYMGAYPYGRPYGWGYGQAYPGYGSGYGYASYAPNPYGAYGYGRGFGGGRGFGRGRWW